MKKLIIILLTLVTLVSYSQDYYRDTVLESVILNEVNNHRNNIGVQSIVFNPDNTRAVDWGVYLVKSTYNGGALNHCGCQAGAEILVSFPVGDINGVTLTYDEIAKKSVSLWYGSPSHKRVMEDNELSRGFISTHIFKDPNRSNKYTVVVVFQLLMNKQYYIDDEWDENELFPKKFGKLTYKI